MLSRGVYSGRKYFWWTFVHYYRSYLNLFHFKTEPLSNWAFTLDIYTNLDVST